jgi:membrane protein
LGAFIALLMWFYLSAYVVLLGGFLNAELDRARRTFANAASINPDPLRDPLAPDTPVEGAAPAVRLTDG